MAIGRADERPPRLYQWQSSIGCFPSSRRTGAAKPLVSYQVIINLISATTTEIGLTVICEPDDNLYPKGMVVSDEELTTINMIRADFHGEWNYTIKPSNRSDGAVDFLNGPIASLLRNLLKPHGPSTHDINTLIWTNYQCRTAGFAETA